LAIRPSSACRRCGWVTAIGAPPGPPAPGCRGRSCGRHRSPIASPLRGAESPWLQTGTPAAVAEDVSGDFGHRHPQLLQQPAPSWSGHPDQPRRRPRPVRPFLRSPGRAVRHGGRAVDEHRRRGGRDRRQDRRQVGLRGQGGRARSGQDHRLRQLLPRPHRHPGEILDRPVAHDHYGPTLRDSRSPSATPTPCAKRSTRKRSPSWSSPSRAGPA
jgi:hypothetical protein